MTNDENFLAHYGKKGMKWGVRKGRSVKPSKDYKQVVNLKQKKIPELSNEQLRTINNRLNLERNYKQLNPSVVKRGQAHIAEALAVVGVVSSIITLSQTPAGKAAIKLGKEAISKIKK